MKEHNIGKKRKTLTVFDEMIADMINNKILNSVVNELLIRVRKINTSTAFITQSNFKVPKDVRWNSILFFIMKIPNQRELQQMALNYSSGIDFKDFIRVYKKCTAEQYPFVAIDLTLPLDSPLRFRKNILK